MTDIIHFFFYHQFLQQGSAKESVGKDLLFLNPFLGGKYKKGEDITLLDISLNRMNYLNFRHVV